MTAKAVDRWYSEMPREEEMLPKDKYTIFDRKEKKYRKGIHSQYRMGGPASSKHLLTHVLSQNCPSGQESVNGSILLAFNFYRPSTLGGVRGAGHPAVIWQILMGFPERVYRFH